MWKYSYSEGLSEKFKLTVTKIDCDIPLYYKICSVNTLVIEITLNYYK